jgi:uncharacterized protein
VSTPPTGRNRSAIAFAPLDRTSAWWWIVCALCGLLVGQVVGVFAAQAATALSGYHGSLSALAQAPAPPAAYVVGSLVGLWVGFGLGPIVASYRFGTSHFASDLSLGARPIDLLGVPIGLASVVLVSVINQLLYSGHRDLSGPAHRLTAGFHGTGAWVIAALTVIGAPFFEELFFRGLLGRALVALATGATASRGGRQALVVGAVILDGICFSAIHAEKLQFVALAVFGCVLMTCATLTGRLTMSMSAHATFNLVAMAQLYHVGPWH